jgi:hypothetical protein
MASIINMENFVYNAETAHVDWPLWNQRLQNFFRINNIGFAIVTANPGGNPPVLGETTALAHGHLLHAGGPKITEINNAHTTAQLQLNYVTLVAILDARFARANTRVSEYQFTNCFQTDTETLADYATRLTSLARQAGVPEANINARVISVIQSTTTDFDTRMKCLDEGNDLNAILTWRKAHDVKLACSANMDQNKRADVLQIKTRHASYNNESEQECFMCGQEYPHVDRECPAKGKNCHTCGKMNHFAEVCLQNKPKRNNPYARHNRSSNNNRLNTQNKETTNKSSNTYTKHSGRTSSVRSVTQTTAGNGSKMAQASKPNDTPFEQLTQAELCTEFEKFYRLRQQEAQAEDVKQSTSSDTINQINFINRLTPDELIACPRRVIKIGGQKVTHLIDTGTNLNIISSATYFLLNSRPFLNTTKIRAFGFHSKLQIPLLGEFFTEVEFRNSRRVIKYIVLDGKADDILGYTAATQLEIIVMNGDEVEHTEYLRCAQRENLLRIVNGYKQLTITQSDKSPSLTTFRTITPFSQGKYTRPGINSAQAAIDQSPLQEDTHYAQHDITCNAKLNKDTSPASTSFKTLTQAVIAQIIAGRADQPPSPEDTHPALFTGQIGHLRDYEISLETDQSFRPIQQPAYPIPFAMRALAKAKLDSLESQGVISKANGKRLLWISPCHPVAKLDAEGNLKDVRITCNAKQLNKALIQQKRHIPSVPELTANLAGSVVFSILDFIEAFSQMSFAEQSKCLMGMSTVFGLYYYNRLNMGISLASELFQEIMEKVLEGIEHIKIALDDVLIHTKDITTHEKILNQCLDRIQACGMTLNPTKCKFYKPEVDFFGMNISAAGIKPKQQKFQALLDCKEPESTKGVRSFLGLTGHFKNRSPYQSSVDKPLRNLLKKNKPFKFGEEERKAYLELKKIVIQEEMAFFNNKYETELYTDAGPDGCSSFLTQRQEDGSIKLVKCDSHSFTEAELNYSHLEKEAFACVWACRVNHIYVYGRHFWLITDALSVKKIFEEDKTRKRTPIRFIRWKSDLSVYNCTFVHRAGSKNIADYLSRHFNTRTEQAQPQMDTSEMEYSINQIVEEKLPTSIDIDTLVQATQQDAQLQEAIRSLPLRYHRRTENLKPFQKIWSELSSTSRGILMRNDIPVIPASLRQQIISTAHEGHMGISKTKSLLRNICWFPGMSAQIQEHIEGCIACQCNTPGNAPEPIQTTQMPKDPWHTLAIDHSSKSPTNEYGLSIYDEGSRTTMLKLSKDLTSATAIQKCKEVFAQHGIPKVIKTDNGPAFISGEWAAFVRDYGFKHQKITPLHPEANAGAERTMKNENKVIRCALIEKSPWKKEMKQYLERYNQTPHTATKYSPNMLKLGHDNCNILPSFNNRHLTPQILQNALGNDEAAKARMKAYADKAQHTKQRSLSINDPVIVKYQRKSKYDPIFDPHPYRINKLNNTMITATRRNHSITRNSQFFKLISEKCYENAMKIVEGNNKSTTKPYTQYRMLHHAAILTPATIMPQTPPDTPANAAQPRPQVHFNETPQIIPASASPQRQQQQRQRPPSNFIMSPAATAAEIMQAQTMVQQQTEPPSNQPPLQPTMATPLVPQSPPQAQAQQLGEPALRRSARNQETKSYTNAFRMYGGSGKR